MANMVEHYPDLVCLRVKGIRARKEWTTKLGDRQYVTLHIKATTILPPISCKGLKYLALAASRDQSSELFEPSPCDLSCLTHVSFHGFSTDHQLSLMKAYNIGENLEFMHKS
jgi:hypothetical protein